MSCAQSSGVTMSCADSSRATPSHARYRARRQRTGERHRAVASRARASAAAPPPPLLAAAVHEPSGGPSSGRCTADADRGGSRSRCGSLRYAMTAFAYTGTLARPCRAPGATLWREKRLLQRQRDHIADIGHRPVGQSHRINNRALAARVASRHSPTTRAKIGAINAIVDLDSHGPSGLPGTVWFGILAGYMSCAMLLCARRQVGGPLLVARKTLIALALLPIVGHLQPEVVGCQVSSHCNRGGSRLQAVQHQLLHALPGAGQRGTLLESNSSVWRYWTKVRSGSPVRITHSSYSAGILELYLLELLGEVFQLQEFKSSL